MRVLVMAMRKTVTVRGAHQSRNPGGRLESARHPGRRLPPHRSPRRAALARPWRQVPTIPPSTRRDPTSKGRSQERSWKQGRRP